MSTVARLKKKTETVDPDNLPPAPIETSVRHLHEHAAHIREALGVARRCFDDMMDAYETGLGFEWEQAYTQGSLKFNTILLDLEAIDSDADRIGGAK